jgi:transposase
MGAVRPQTPHRSPRQAFGGTWIGPSARKAWQEGWLWMMNEPMEANLLFARALGLGNGWKVIKSEMNVEGRRLGLWLDFEAGAQFACPQCEQWCPVHDTVEKKWRHLDFWQHRTELRARVPRIKCEEHGVLQAQVPWARPGSGFTLMMEAMILLLGQEMTVSAAASYLGENDTRLWRVLDHYVMAAHRQKDWSQVTRIMVDETSARRGHRYVTVVLDADSHDLLFMVQGRSGQALVEFAAAMPAHQARPEQITHVVMDMSPAYIAGAEQAFPQARIVFDHFHIMKLAGEALDEVRKALRKQGADLFGGLWALRGNSWTRSAEQQALRLQLGRSYPKLGRAMALRETLQDVLAEADVGSLHWWLGWAARSRLEPFRKLARTIKDHFQGILAYLETRLTNAAIEAVNGILQMAKRMARGFRNFHYFRLAAYLKAGHLNIHQSPFSPT